MVELAHILRQFGPTFQQTYQDQLLPSHRRTIHDICHCRTAVFGGHLYTCQECHATQYSYHSCQNRHCPKCQHQAGQDWLQRQQDLLLPVPYFLLTFTLPDGLRSLALGQQKLIYNLLFRASAAATQQLAQDPRFVGGQIGMVGVLHTWGRNLAYHPHVHYLVPGGGVDENGRWQSSRHNFLVPVRALSVLFRARFRDALQRTPFFDQIPASVWRQPWVVHCKPVGDGRTALRYLAPYVFRVAISNRRILKLAHGKVSFRYFASETGKPRTCTVTATEFIRRFLQHVLPKGFVKVRYYGFFAPGLRHRLQAIRQQLPSLSPSAAVTSALATQPPERTISCPRCGQPMTHRQRVWPRSRWPPSV
jgi:hypothetical protein